LESEIILKTERKIGIMPHTKTPLTLIKERGTGFQADIVTWIIRTKRPATNACKANPDLCKVFTLGGDTEGEETGEANAHLFLTAPRLLNSLQELSAWMRAHTGPGDGTHEMLCRAVEAIKATGEPLRDSWEG
jgi:hypothetical protein